MGKDTVYDAVAAANVTSFGLGECPYCVEILVGNTFDGKLAIAYSFEVAEDWKKSNYTSENDSTGWHSTAMKGAYRKRKPGTDAMRKIDGGPLKTKYSDYATLQVCR